MPGSVGPGSLPVAAGFGPRGTPTWTVVIGLAGNLAPLPPGYVEIARSETLVALAQRNG